MTYYLYSYGDIMASTGQKTSLVNTKTTNNNATSVKYTNIRSVNNTDIKKGGRVEKKVYNATTEKLPPYSVLSIQKTEAVQDYKYITHNIISAGVPSGTPADIVVVNERPLYPLQIFKPQYTGTVYVAVKDFVSTNTTAWCKTVVGETCLVAIPEKEDGAKCFPIVSATTNKQYETKYPICLVDLSYSTATSPAPASSWIDMYITKTPEWGDEIIEGYKWYQAKVNPKDTTEEPVVITSVYRFYGRFALDLANPNNPWGNAQPTDEYVDFRQFAVSFPLGFKIKVLKVANPLYNAEDPQEPYDKPFRYVLLDDIAWCGDTSIASLQCIKGTLRAVLK